MEFNYKGDYMAYLQLDTGEKIAKGNFAFILDKTNNVELFDKFFEAEKIFKLNYVDFAHKIRVAYEGFALYEETLNRMQLSENTHKLPEEIEKAIVGEITAYGSTLNYKKIIIRLTREKSAEYRPMLDKYGFTKGFHNDTDCVRSLKNYIQFVYNFASMSSHVNREMQEEYIPNRENCLRVIGSFHDFLCIYYGVTKRFDSTLIPIRDYIPVPKTICENMGMSLDIGKYLFVMEKRGKCAYYIFSSDIESISLAQRRDLDTISKLWEDNFDDPVNVIRQTEHISGSNGDYKFQVYSLPNRPLKLTKEMLSDLTIEDKMDIISGLCRGVLSLHNYDPPFYHRNICPEAFYIFNVKGKYKALLARFDCTKDNSDDATYTVYANVEKKLACKKTNQFFAPEILQSELGQGVDWAKADIYSLAKTCLFILSGEIIDKEAADFLDECDIDDSIKCILFEMLSEKPEDRPKIEEVMKKMR